MINSYNKSKKSYRGSAAVMFSAATLLCVYIACAIPQLTIPMCFVSSIFIMGIMLEKMYFVAILSFIVVLFISFLIVPLKYLIVPYIVFFGHYGIFKFIIDARVENIVGAMILKLIYFNIALFVMYMFDSTLLTGGAFNMPIWLIVVLAEIIFVVYDFLFTKISTMYYERGRQNLLNSSRYD